MIYRYNTKNFKKLKDVKFYYCIFCDQIHEIYYFKLNNWYGLQESYGNKYKYIFGNTLPCYRCYKHTFTKFYLINFLNIHFNL